MGKEMSSRCLGRGRRGLKGNRVEWMMAVDIQRQRQVVELAVAAHEVGNGVET